MTPGGVENGAIELAVLKSPIWTRDRVSSPSGSHFSPGLKLILRTQVTNPDHGRFQSLSKGVYILNAQEFIVLILLRYCYLNDSKSYISKQQFVLWSGPLPLDTTGAYNSQAPSYVVISPPSVKHF